MRSEYCSILTNEMWVLQYIDQSQLSIAVSVLINDSKVLQCIDQWEVSIAVSVLTNNSSVLPGRPRRWGRAAWWRLPPARASPPRQTSGAPALQLRPLPYTPSSAIVHTELITHIISMTMAWMIGKWLDCGPYIITCVNSSTDSDPDISLPLQDKYKLRDVCSDKWV